MRLHLYLKHFPADGQRLIGGTAKAVNGLAYGLAQAGAEVTILCEGERTRTRRSKLGFLIQSFENRATRNPFLLSKDLTASYNDPTSTPDLVILNGSFHPSVASLSRVLRARAVPYVIATHEVHHPKLFAKNPHLKWPFWYIYERQVLECSSAIQLLDQRHGKHLKKLKISATMIEIPNGFLPEDVKRPRRLPTTMDGTCRLLFFGRIDVVHKGLDVLLASVRDISDSDKVHLVIQGPDWGDQQKLKGLIRQFSLFDKVVVRAPDYATPVGDVMSHYHIVCLPSRWEGFGLASLEAMLASRVVLVAEDAGIAPHVAASGCGVLVKPEVCSVVKGIRDLLRRREEWSEMGRRGRSYALEHLSWEQIGKRALNEYSKLLD